MIATMHVEPSVDTAPAWSAATRILFRFSVVYFGLYVVVTQMLPTLLLPAELTLVDPNSFLLVTRGFHWIQEFPFNR